jgi:hypothetical protein
VGDKIEKTEMGGGHNSDWGRGEACTGFWWKNLRKRDHWGRLMRKWKDNIKMNLQEVELGIWTGLSWLRIETVGGQL